MKILVVLRQSSKAIFRNKGRSFLTILGIIIGIGSVIALISMGTGVKASISSRISSLGTTNLTIQPGKTFASAPSNQSSSSNKGGFNGGPSGDRGGFGQTASTLAPADLASLSDHTKHPKITAVTGNINGSAVFSVNGSDQRQTITGVSSSYFGMHTLKAAKGTVFTAGDVKNTSKVVVLGHQFAIDVLKGDASVGSNLTINNNQYQVVGVLAQADGNGFVDFNSMAFIPNTAAAIEFSTPNYSNLTVQADTENDVDAVKTDVTNTLLTNHKITDAKLADFSVLTSKDLLGAISNITGLLTSLLAGIAAISLVVGGIGIMNIMLVSVTERTREIGLRKAVGAKTFDIMAQFVTEAIMLTLAGGLLGIGLGRLIGIVAAKALGFDPIITMGAVLLAVGVSGAVGIVFGVYPAAKAARLNPIDALRYE